MCVDWPLQAQAQAQTAQALTVGSDASAAPPRSLLALALCGEVRSDGDGAGGGGGDDGDSEGDGEGDGEGAGAAPRRRGELERPLVRAGPGAQFAWRGLLEAASLRARRGDAGAALRALRAFAPGLASARAAIASPPPATDSALVPAPAALAPAPPGWAGAAMLDVVAFVERWGTRGPGGLVGAGAGAGAEACAVAESHAVPAPALALVLANSRAPLQLCARAADAAPKYGPLQVRDAEPSLQPRAPRPIISLSPPIRFLPTSLAPSLARSLND